MSADINECRLSGTIDRVREIHTRSGAAMAEVLLHVRQDKFRVTAFNNLASHLLTHGKAGDRLAVTGSLSVSNWKDEATGEWKNSFSVTAWAIELNGQQLAYQKEKTQANQPKERPTIREAQPGDVF